MSKKYYSPEKAIGNTPLVRLSGIEKHLSLPARLYAKIEKGNLTGSVKDRPALFMLKDFERRGLLREGGRIVEATSGNMGISLAALSIRGGYRAVIIMPRGFSEERRKMIRLLGAELILTDGDMSDAVALARKMSKEGEALWLRQFDNPMNSQAHERTTGPEIYNALQGRADVFVAGVGTGGTLDGVGKYLKKKNPGVKIVAVEPKESPVLSGGKPSNHRIQGIGARFLPTILDKNAINEVITVGSDEATEGVKLLALVEGIPSGISSGAAVMGAVRVAKEVENGEKNIVTLLPDGIEKYLTY